ncbi:hypothetical protein VKT23_013573 [Stygiomarasmius scandens]|uniref:F-box domain-containing protein n=1 Tax=Marasmiellus scandens TaxID=2682957 RepID=A0ABR1J7F7_9AGAR
MVPPTDAENPPNILLPVDVSLARFRSGHCPSDVEIGTLKGFCEEALKEIAHNDAEARKLRDSLALLERRTLDLEQSVQRCRAFASVVRRVPTEIWVEIFSECIKLVGSSLSLTGYYEPFVSSCTLAFSQTCSFWRAITLSTPKLWSKLRLDLYTVSPGLGDLVQLFVQRSDPSPLVLDVRFLGGEPSEYGWRTFWDLVHFRSRWLQAEVHAYHIPLPHGMSTQIQFPILEKLKLPCEFDETDDPARPDFLPILLNGSRSLHSLDIYGFRRVFAPSFANLSDICLKLTSIQDLVDCLTLCPQLRKADLSGFYIPVEERPLSAPLEKIAHSMLSSLDFEFVIPDEAITILPSLVLPSLVTLNVYYDLDSLGERYDDASEYLDSLSYSIESLRAMIVQSSCQLQRLQLGAGFVACGQRASDRALIDLLTLMPNLTHLEIDAQRYSAFSDQFFRKLTLSTSCVPAEKPLLPLLQDFRVSIGDNPEFYNEGEILSDEPLPNSELILTMLKSRRAEGSTIVRLQTFHFCVTIDRGVVALADEWIRFFNTDTKPQLCALQADGLGLVLRVAEYTGSTASESSVTDTDSI